jgi:hypothetical protein
MLASYRFEPLPHWFEDHLPHLIVAVLLLAAIVYWGIDFLLLRPARQDPQSQHYSDLKQPLGHRNGAPDA